MFSRNSFVAVSGDEVLAQIKFERAGKIDITEFTFSDIEAAKKLAEHVLSKYKMPFKIAVDETEKELVGLLMSLGFRQCLTESLWKVGEIDAEALPYRRFKKSDAKSAAALYNDELINHFRSSLERTKSEFKTGYILESTGRPISYLSVENSVAEFSNSSGYDIPIDGILAFAGAQFVKLKKYTTNDFEKYLTERGFERIQTKIILVKDFYKPVKHCTNTLSCFFFRNLSSHGCS